MYQIIKILKDNIKDYSQTYIVYFFSILGKSSLINTYGDVVRSSNCSSTENGPEFELLTAKEQYLPDLENVRRTFEEIEYQRYVTFEEIGDRKIQIKIRIMDEHRLSLHKSGHFSFHYEVLLFHIE